ncbi:MAG: hypothetical protein ACFE8L_01945 [Candidatus Hodarchaeota archaeon]
MSFLTGLKDLFKKPIYAIILIAFIISWFLILFGYLFIPYEGYNRIVAIFIAILAGFVFFLLIISLFKPIDELNFIIVIIIFIVSLPILIIFRGILGPFYRFCLVANQLLTAFFAFKLCMDSSTKVDDYLYKKEFNKITRALEFIIFGLLTFLVLLFVWRILAKFNVRVVRFSANVFRIMFWVDLILICFVLVRLISVKKFSAYITLFFLLTFFYILYIIVDLIAEFIFPDAATTTWYFFLIDLGLFLYIIGSIFDKVDYLKNKFKIIRADTISIFVVLMKLITQVIKLPGFEGMLVSTEEVIRLQIFLLVIFILFTLLFGIHSIFAHKEGETPE